MLTGAVASKTPRKSIWFFVIDEADRTASIKHDFLTTSRRGSALLFTCVRKI